MGSLCRAISLLRTCTPRWISRPLPAAGLPARFSTGDGDAAVLAITKRGRKPKATTADTAANPGKAVTEKKAKRSTPATKSADKRAPATMKKEKRKAVDTMAAAVEEDGSAVRIPPLDEAGDVFKSQRRPGPDHAALALEIESRTFRDQKSFLTKLDELILQS